MRILTDVNIDWLRWRWHALALSWLIILGGAYVVVTRGLPLGIDFAGGTNVVVKFEQPMTADQVRQAITPVARENVVQQFGDPAEREWLIKVPMSQTAEQGFELEKTGNDVVASLRSANLGTFDVRSTEVVGPVIGRDLQQKGIYATFASLVGIMLYIAFRFRLSFGIGAMVASIHDVLITLSMLVFLQYELSLNVIAAILTLVGYGVNDQIVIFDRVRENLRSNRREPMNAVINRSVNQTLPRTAITAGTTFLSVLSLFLFGGEVLEPFAFAMLVGIVTSTYSTVFIASAIAVLLSQGKASAAAPSEAATRPARKGGRARAS
jgi:preprotein translocase subunit SecF